VRNKQDTHVTVGAMDHLVCLTYYALLCALTLRMT